MKHIFFLLLLFTLANYCISQATYSDQDIIRKVILLRNEDGSHATGIILKFKDHYLLLTATHVTMMLQKTAKVFYNNGKNSADSINLSDIVPPGSVIVGHEIGDIEFLALTPRNDNDLKLFDTLSFPSSIIYNQLKDIDRQFNIIVYGYPLYTFENFEAISINSFLSSGLVQMNRADTQKPCWFYLLENPAMAGFSGGPVFIGVQHGGMNYGPSQTILIGIVHGVTSDQTGAKFAMITPAYYIADLLGYPRL